MKLFKNKVGRPSNETLRNRRIAVYSLVVVVAVIFCFAFVWMDKALTGSSIIDSESKNASAVTITYKDYSSTSPKVGAKATFKHTISNAYGKYQRWFTYTNGTRTAYGKCTKIVKNPYNEADSFSSNTAGTKKYLRVVVYSDSKCNNVIKSANSKTFTWTKSSTPSSNNGGKVTIKFDSYNTKTPKTGQTVKFRHVVTNAKGYRQRWFTVKNGSIIKQGGCDYLNTNNYTEQDSLSPETNSSIKKLLRVTIYSDASCTKKVATADSATFSWSTSNNNPTPSPSTPTTGKCTSNNSKQTANNTTFCVVRPSSSDYYSKVSSQPSGNLDCFGYAVSYGYMMQHNAKIKSLTFSTAKGYTKGKSTASSDSNYYDAIRNSIKSGQGVVVHVASGNGGCSGYGHYILIYGVKEGSINKSASSLSRQDFLAMDPLKKTQNQWSLLSSSGRPKCDNNYYIVK